MTPEIQELINRGALFVANHSAGKDSQAMLIYLKTIIPANQLLVLHADLGKIEWPGTIEHIQSTRGALTMIVAHAATSFFDMVDRRGMFPDPARRQCTSDLKRGPIEREIRRYLRANPQFNGLVVNCMGLRAGESSSRAKRPSLKFNARNSKAGREWYDWLPIQWMTTLEVFAYIADAGERHHWAYDRGMTRLSCCFCIMASKQDLITAAQENPTLYREYCVKEIELGFTLSPSRKTLPEITGIQP